MGKTSKERVKISAAFILQVMECLSLLLAVEKTQKEEAQEQCVFGKHKLLEEFKSRLVLLEETLTVPDMGSWLFSLSLFRMFPWIFNSLFC